MTKIAVVGTGYVGLANAVLLAQYNEVIAYDIDEDRVAKINRGEPTIEDAELALFLREKPLNLVATTDKEQAYLHADYIVVATPTNYDPDTNYFDTSSVESVVADIVTINPRRHHRYQVNYTGWFHKATTRKHGSRQHHFQS